MHIIAQYAELEAWTKSKATRHSQEFCEYVCVFSER